MRLLTQIEALLVLLLPTAIFAGTITIPGIEGDAARFIRDVDRSNVIRRMDEATLEQIQARINQYARLDDFIMTFDQPSLCAAIVRVPDLEDNLLRLNITTLEFIYFKVDDRTRQILHDAAPKAMEKLIRYLNDKGIPIRHEESKINRDGRAGDRNANSDSRLPHKEESPGSQSDCPGCQGKRNGPYPNEDQSKWSEPQQPRSSGHDRAPTQYESPHREQPPHRTDGDIQERYPYWPERHEQPPHFYPYRYSPPQYTLPYPNYDGVNLEVNQCPCEATQCPCREQPPHNYEAEPRWYQERPQEYRAPPYYGPPTYERPPAYYEQNQPNFSGPDQYPSESSSHGDQYPSEERHSGEFNEEQSEWYPYSPERRGYPSHDYHYPREYSSPPSERRYSDFDGNQQLMDQCPYQSPFEEWGPCQYCRNEPQWNEDWTYSYEYPDHQDPSEHPRMWYDQYQFPFDLE